MYACMLKKRIEKNKNQSFIINTHLYFTKAQLQGISFDKNTFSVPVTSTLQS